jgi:superoxide reductase
MTKRNEIYKCDACGQIIEVLVGGTKLKCCGQSMELQAENTVDAAVEKHVPVFEKTGRTVKVKVGSAAHPMEEKHYIQWIEVIAGDQTLRTYLNPGDAPEAEFCVDADEVTVRAYCNLHGNWKA